MLLLAIVLQLRQIGCLLMPVNHGLPIQPAHGLGSEVRRQLPHPRRYSMQPSRRVRIAAVAAAVFGALTVVTGALALFGGAQAQAAVGNAVPFVLWFNFLAGFAYVAAAIGIWRGLRWGAWTAVALAVLTAVVALVFGVHVMGGAAYEMRTVGALSLRVVFWVAISAIAMRSLPATPQARAV
jgi:cation transport ATPase